MPRPARGVSMEPCGTASIGRATRQVARNLPQQQLRELLTAVMQTPTGVVLKVGYVLRLFLAVIKTSLPTSDRIGGSRGRDGLAVVSETSHRVIRAAAGSPAARYGTRWTNEEKKQEAAIIATAQKDIKQAQRAQTFGGKGGKDVVKGSRRSETANKAGNLQSWAARAKRTGPSLLELLETGVAAIEIEDARLIISHAKAIPAEKAARVRICIGRSTAFCWVS